MGFLIKKKNINIANSSFSVCVFVSLVSDFLVSYVNALYSFHPLFRIHVFMCEIMPRFRGPICENTLRKPRPCFTIHSAQCENSTRIDGRLLSSRSFSFGYWKRFDGIRFKNRDVSEMRGALAARCCFCRLRRAPQWRSTEELSEDNGQLMVFVTQAALPLFHSPRNEISETPIKLLRVEELTPLVTRLFSVAQSFLFLFLVLEPITLFLRRWLTLISSRTRVYCGRKDR